MANPTIDRELNQPISEPGGKQVVSNSVYVKDEVALGHSNVLITMNQKRFYASQQCNEAREALEKLVKNPSYNTDSDYYNGATLDFVNRHLQYLSTHPLVKIDGYVSNLKLMTSTKRRVD